MLKNLINQWWYKLARYLCTVFCYSLFRMRVYGLDNIPAKGPFLLLSNHQSYIDPLFCGIRLHRPVWYVARDSLFRHWFFGALLRSVNAIPIRRGQSDVAAIKKIIERLRAGDGVGLFAEGTRTEDGRIADIKPGFGLLGRRGNAPIVPVLIDGAFECWPRQKRIFSMGAVTVCYGRPITAEQIKKVGDDEFAKLLTATLRKMQNDCRARQGKKIYNYSD